MNDYTLYLWVHSLYTGDDIPPGLLPLNCLDSVLQGTCLGWGMSLFRHMCCFFSECWCTVYDISTEYLQDCFHDSGGQYRTLEDKILAVAGENAPEGGSHSGKSGDFVNCHYDPVKMIWCEKRCHNTVVNMQMLQFVTAKMLWYIQNFLVYFI